METNWPCVEFDKIKRVDGVILLDWSDRSLQRQVELGTKEKKIDPQVARFELENYKSNIIAVADFFDQQGYLHLVGCHRERSWNATLFMIKAGDRRVKRLPANGNSAKYSTT